MNTEEEVVVLSEPKRKTIKWDEEQLLSLVQQVYASKPYAVAVKKASAYEDVAYILMRTDAFKGYALSGYKPSTFVQNHRRIC
jgi:hypothetical protein